MRKIPVIFALVLSTTFCFSSIARGQSKLPTELNNNSSLSKILQWLSGVIPQAILGLDNNAPDPQSDDVLTDVTPYSERAEFSSGYVLGAINGCRIDLANDNAGLISFTSKYPDLKRGDFPEFWDGGEGFAKHPATFVIRLDSLNEKRRKRPLEYKRKYLSAPFWRVEYTLRGSGGILVPFHLPSRDKIKEALQNPALRATLKGYGSDGRDESMSGDTLSFLFDSKARADEFDAAFRLAISKCK